MAVRNVHILIVYSGAARICPREDAHIKAET